MSRNDILEFSFLYYLLLLMSSHNLRTIYSGKMPRVDENGVNFSFRFALSVWFVKASLDE